MITNIRHTGLVVQDLDKSLHFWCDVMGFTVARRMDEAGPHIDAIMELDDVAVTTVKLAAPDGNLLELLKFTSHPDKSDWEGSPVSTGLTHMAFTVNDLEATCATLLQHGVRLHSDIQFSPDGMAKLVYCRGPEGLILELVEMLAS
ncbi:glyoxalase [Cohaesibacter sp. CAU 1516]|uniref:VOC family protein n=1 Tax=Cohaesibacter sp. CAU 1516 TaxID=2576038 RepID=UPI0010FD50AE|nr:VOC family protein [Cohaesibacter sp. CAU 1516]TLP48517.1 glyoxalase [Cohaesibacter sp. CAU 1516]